MTIGELTVYLAYLTKFFKPVKDLATTTNAIAQAAVGAERVRAILDTTDTTPERPDGLEPKTLEGEIEFNHIAFGYDSQVPVLKDISFRITSGQFVGVVGPTGSGKSTIVSLIPRFYDVQEGQVLIDGHDVRDYKLKELRDQIGYVLRIRSYFAGLFAIILRSAGPMRPWQRLLQRLSWPMLMISSVPCRSAMRRWWEIGVRHSQVASVSASASHAS